MENQKIKKLEKSEMSELMLLFRMLELVSANDKEFDPRDALNEHDDLYKPLMRHFDVGNSDFDYKAFMVEVGQRIGSKLQKVLLGYESLVENFCDPASEVLQARADVIVLAEGEFLTKGKLLGEHSTISDWFKAMYKWIAEFGNSRDRLQVLDARNISITGEDMKVPDSKVVFPVKTYLLEK
jgi:hypothetical protein